MTKLTKLSEMRAALAEDGAVVLTSCGNWWVIRSADRKQHECSRLMERLMYGWSDRKGQAVVAYSHLEHRTSVYTKEALAAKRSAQR